MRSVGTWLVLAMALVGLPVGVANAACAVGADCVPPQYTAWCHARGDDGAGNLPPHTCSAAQNSQLGFFNYADDTDWSIRVFKNVYSFVSGVATPAAPETLSYNVWPEPVGRHQIAREFTGPASHPMRAHPVFQMQLELARQ